MKKRAALLKFGGIGIKKLSRQTGQAAARPRLGRRFFIGQMFFRERILTVFPGGVFGWLFPENGRNPDGVWTGYIQT